MSNTVNSSIIKKSDYKQYFEKGIGYGLHNFQMAEDLISNEDPKIKEYIKLNQHRMMRVEKTYHVSSQITEQVNRLKHKTYWLILTEHWCGDASQTLPVFNKIAEMCAGKIEMKLLYRDQNPKLMDAYLTNGTRSIPKLIQLDERFNVTGIWGPRPTEAQKLVRQLRSDPATSGSYANELHLWYAKDKQQLLDSEILKLIFRANFFCADCLS